MKAGLSMISATEILLELDPKIDGKLALESKIEESEVCGALTPHQGVRGGFPIDPELTSLNLWLRQTGSYNSA